MTTPTGGIGEFMQRPDLSANRPEGVGAETDKAAAAAPDPAQLAEVAKAIPTKKRADFFVAVRQRGLTNAMMEQADNIIREKYPDMETRWEYAPPNGDDTMVIAREGQGFRVVHNSELGDGRRPGPVRVGDLIQMVGPKDLVAELNAADARAAHEDLKAPEEAFRASLEKNKVTTKAGTQEGAVPFGEIKQTTEVRTAFSRPDGSIAVAPKE